MGAVMKYVYPKLSRFDALLFRFGGAGLGNLLFTYGRALQYAKENNCIMIWPTWPSIKIGPYLRHERDKRSYVNLFVNKQHYIHGIKKAAILLANRKIKEEDSEKSTQQSGIVVFEKFIGSFKSIKDSAELIRNDLEENLRNKHVLNFNPQGTIAIHVRLGDFSKATVEELKGGKHDRRLPIEWYCDMLAQIRTVVSHQVKACVYSDGTDAELSSLLSMPNVERKTFGNAINDIIALSRAPLLIASGSSFSMWARYLGRHNTICYVNQMKERILGDGEAAFEIEVENEIPAQYHGAISRCLKD
jgi:hypothetical protein